MAITIGIISTIILFLFGLDSFSKEIQRISGESFRNALGRLTDKPIYGVLIGAIVTALIQSSSATTVITLGLVNAGVISFKNSIGIVFGSSVGTTITAQLIAFKLTTLGPWFIVLGTLISISKTRYRFIGKSIFYFGFVFFSLNFVSDALMPLKESTLIVQYLTSSQSLVVNLLIGTIITALVQSSSVVSGLAILLVAQGMLSLENAVPIVIGANIGTTSTALIASLSADFAAKKLALALFLFKVGGVLLCLPFMGILTQFVSNLTDVPEIALANAHLIFNLSASAIFLIFINQFKKLVDKLMPDDTSVQYPHLVFPDLKQLENERSLGDFSNLMLAQLFDFTKENYTLISLSIETNHQKFFNQVIRRNEYINNLRSEVYNFFSQAINHTENTETQKDLIIYIDAYDYFFQLVDSTNDLIKLKKSMDEMLLSLNRNDILMLRDLSNKNILLFEAIGKFIKQHQEQDFKPALDNLELTVRQCFHQVIKNHSENLGFLMQYLTISRKFKDRLKAFMKEIHELKLQNQEITES
jgi:phosphate:Na+ symporter